MKDPRQFPNFWGVLLGLVGWNAICALIGVESLWLFLLLPPCLWGGFKLSYSLHEHG